MKPLLAFPCSTTHSVPGLLPVTDLWGQKSVWNPCTGKKYYLLLWGPRLILAGIGQATKHWGSRRFGTKGKGGRGKEWRNWWKQATWEDSEYTEDTGKKQDRSNISRYFSNLGNRQNLERQKTALVEKYKRIRNWSISVFFQDNFKCGMTISWKSLFLSCSKRRRGGGEDKSCIKAGNTT